MNFTQSHQNRLRRVVSIIMLINFTIGIALPPCTAQDEVDETIYVRFEEVSSLRSQGQYDRAIVILQEMIEEYQKSDEILRRAYTDLVFTFLAKGDDEASEAVAREALLRYPDLKAEPVRFPDSVNEKYDELRAQMFGSLKVVTKPDSCRIFLNHEFMGFSPLNLKYIEVGEYILNASKTGHHDQSDPIQIEPGSPTSIQVSLERQRDKKWWAWRVVPAALAAGALVALQVGGSSPGGGDTPTPLDEPPPPPGN